jgi:hypothetical protein
LDPQVVSEYTTKLHTHEDTSGKLLARKVKKAQTLGRDLTEDIDVLFQELAFVSADKEKTKEKEGKRTPAQARSKQRR